MMLHGVIPVRKPAGITSHDVVARLRRLTGQKRIGHTGTLDPDVEGVLPICLGQATRIVEYIQELPKRYQGTMILGISTDTQDQSGQVTERKPVSGVDMEQVRGVFQRFTGEVEQIPPMYSAVKVGGKRLYEWAREGKEVKRKTRRVFIHELTLSGMDLDDAYPRIHFEVLCSKGTYVRTLCVDLGRALGYPAHMSRLVRVKSGPFSLQDSHSLEELERTAAEDRWIEVMMSPGEVLGHLPVLVVPDSAYAGVMNGMPLSWEEPLRPSPAESLCRVYTEQGEFCGLYRLADQQTARPEKVFRVR